MLRQLKIVHLEMTPGATGVIQELVSSRLKVGRVHCHQELYVADG